MAITLDLEVPNPSGLHARPAAAFVKACAGYRSDIRVANLTTGSVEASGKSILSVLQLGVARGHRIRLRVEGEDEAEASAALRRIVESGLGESLAAS